MAEKPLRPRDPDFRARVDELWARSHFITHLGLVMDSLEPGHCVSRLPLQEFHRQQNGFVHAGAIATMADHTAGVAAGSLIGPGQVVLTVEFKINLLRPTIGEELICRSRVIQNGLTVIPCESEVYYRKGGREKLSAKAMVTIGVADARFA